MAQLARTFRTLTLFSVGCANFCVLAYAQTTQIPVPATAPAAAPSASPPAQPFDPPTASTGKPLPDIVALMRDVETNQRKAETIEKDYLYHSVLIQKELDSHGQVKKATVIESDHYWVNGVPIRRIVEKDGKPLSPQETTKQDQQIQKESEKAREKRDKADSEGKPTDPRGEDEITVSRLIELGAFTNPRRVQINGRDTIAVDFTGDPKAKTRNRDEEVIRDLAGTAWIDEQDRVLVRVEGHFANPFKIGGGLIANIQKDTRFAMQQTKINDEVWLPASIDAQGAARFLLFFNFNGSVHSTDSDYRKFRATSTILPGMTQATPRETPTGPSQP